MNHWSQQLNLLQVFRYYIYHLFWSQRWETFIFEVSAISWRAQSYQVMQKYLPHLVLYKQRFLLIHSIYQDSHTVSNLNSAQSNPLKLTTQRLNWQTNFLHQQNAPLPSLHMRFFNCLLLIKKIKPHRILKKMTKSWQTLGFCLFICFFFCCGASLLPFLQSTNQFHWVLVMKHQQLFRYYNSIQISSA